MIHLNLSVIFILSSILFTSACHPNRVTLSDESTLSKAYRLIDLQRTDEAIILLESQKQNSTDNLELMNTLASAYAHKSGIRITTMIPLFLQSGRLKKLNIEFQKYQTKFKDNSKKPDQLRNYIFNLTYLKLFLESLDQIPRVSEDNVIYLRYSISLLNSMGERLRKKDRIYRAILETVYLKYLLAEKSDLVTRMFQRSNCYGQYERNQVSLYLYEVSELMIDTFTDYSFFVKDKENEFLSASKEISQLSVNLNILLNSFFENIQFRPDDEKCIL